jgi:toxin ParE1/3/4
MRDSPMKAIRRPSAKSDLEYYATFLARESGIDLANRFLASAERTIDKLASIPGMGARFELDNPALDGLRYFPIDGFPNHLLFYLWPSADEIVIVRIIHGARNLKRQLNRGDDG